MQQLHWKFILNHNYARKYTLLAEMGKPLLCCIPLANTSEKVLQRVLRVYNMVKETTRPR